MRDAELGNKIHVTPADTSTTRAKRIPYKYVPIEDDEYISFSRKPPVTIETIVDTPETTPQLYTKKKPERRPSDSVFHHKKKLIIVLSLAVLIPSTGLGAYKIFHKENERKDTASNTTSQNGYGIAFYLPKNLPPGYTYNNDVATLKANVYYYTITDPGGKTFHVTQQSIPENFDFAAFNKKFLNPEKFSTEAGTAVVGPVGPNIIGSVQTLKNSWILVNSDNLNTQPNVQSIVRSFSLDK